MKTIGNILWHIPFLGFVNAIIVYLLGLILTATVVAAPIGLGLMELGKLLFWPFGNAMINKKDLDTEPNKAWQTYSTIIMILYFPIGLILLIAAALQVAGLFISIIGIPAALVVAKSLETYLNPVNKKCVPVELADAVKIQKAQAALNNIKS